ncbi:MAG: cell division protein FtsH [Candidatus Omnitrophica bacterium CG08_land_8_20_14_0_20_41_16]|uniref:ATP-dependent zinc metalloprotease FtsH n=1 Tax=Candidatus Sherwoodlollariibacterium unditelluris TaxID=1974757 RepID=A0A2G9YKP0_9BACT|nr:MAG: cell division protein FtsH [Candidatus Omnitrophica bacterium CG23_combo_of_CG06-09_8_20_14_all_41_10]PIS33569.1 MAG: cell division protein FtsH [Candidatus Omnitrophica bacterium CG08_land_8_20_14_0_20_41_16]
MTIIIVFLIINSLNIPIKGIPKEITYGEFYSILKKNPDNIKSVIKRDAILQGEFQGGFKDNSSFLVNIPDNDMELLSLMRQNLKSFDVKPPRTFWVTLLFNLGPIVLLIFFWWMMAARGEQLGSKIMGFGKMNPKIHSESEKVNFNDVAGVDEAKEELKEVIEFLKDPKRFQKLGGKIPKGVLLVGPPGCGKTLIAKAVAGEAVVPFFSISGSDFVEMFVGVGASRVRDLFEQGRKAGKISGKGAIIFIDEIDAVGRLRFSGIGGGHDEREQTLNALLVEMDGFDTQQGLILIAATNRPDTLDPALLRPGRFDRTIIVNLPDIKGREEILKVHTRKIKLAPSVDLKSVASQTPGFSGADLANLCNEAALLAARNNKEEVEEIDFDKSVERVLMGPEKKSHIISKKEKEITALHESGHALLSLLLPEVNPLKKVSIIPRGLAGGYTFTPPLEDRHYWTKKELSAEISMMLGGRASEEINLKEVTTGAQNDLELATGMARRMVTQFGMSERLGNITLGRREGLVFLGRDIMEERNYSDETARLIDEEVKKIVDDAYLKAKSLLEEHLDKLKILFSALLEKEVLDGEEVKAMLGIEKKDIA